MFRKMVWIFAAIILTAVAALGQGGASPAPKKRAPVAPVPKRAPVAPAPVEWPELPAIRGLGMELPALPPLPPLPTLELPALPDFAALPALPALPAFPAVDADDLDGLGIAAQEQAERSREQAERAREKAEREQERIDREEELYADGTEAMDEERWDKAAEKFKQVAEMKGKKADAAFYWQAYSLNKLGRRAEAITTLAELQKYYPKSTYLKDAKALEMEVRAGGRPGGLPGGVQGGVAVGEPAGRPTATSDEDCELKLLALNSMQHQDPERAVPLLEKFLQTGSSNCPKLRKQALFVLAQSGSPRARAVMEQVARGQLAADLQREAINNLGVFGGQESRKLLRGIYASTGDVAIKKRILQSFMVSGEKEFLLDAARNEKDPELRAAAVQQLGVMGAREELWQMYQQETTTDVKGRIIQALFVGGDADHMILLAKSEKDRDLRLKAVRSLGLMGSKRTGDALLELYTSEKDYAVRKEVLNAFFLQGNAHQLIEIYKKETDPELRKEAVRKLSLINSKEAIEFMMEILNKP